jgi:hypothetical protein
MNIARVAFVLSFLPLVACSAGDPSIDSSQGSDLERSSVMARAEAWVSVKMPYCQVPNHHYDIDPYCSAICTRPNDPTWDPYRSDCSGFVSYAWGLGAPGRVTMQFAPFVNDITHVIAATDLQPGDAVNNNEHVMLFKSWVTHGSVATFVEEPGCQSSQPYAREVTSPVSINGGTIHVSFNGMTFYAIRLNSISGAAKPPSPPPVPSYRVVRSQGGKGYWQLKSDGAVFGWGDAKYSGGANTLVHPAPIVGMAADPTGGYWQAAADGAIYGFGAPYRGGVNTIPHTGPVVGIAASAGTGYWMATQDGAIYSFGDAVYHGGENGKPHAPMIALVATTSGKGYWMLAQDGAVYGFGDAQYHGGANTLAHPAPIVGMAAASGGGYWIVASDGAIYGFGAAYHGGANTIPHPAAIVGIAATKTGGGYWLSAADGAIYGFGDAAYYGGANTL